MKQLPMWHITNVRPSNFDTESLTIIEQTSRVYGAMNALIEEYNNYVDALNKQINKHEEGVNKAIELHTMEMNQSFNDFIDVIQLQIDNFKKQNNIDSKEMRDAISYMEKSIQEFKFNIDSNLEEYVKRNMNDIITVAYSAFYYDANNQEIGYQTMVGAEYDMTYQDEQITVLGSITNNANESINYQLIQGLDTRLKALGG